MNSLYLMDLFMFIAAVYVLYLGIAMKKTGKIHKSLMAGDMISKCTNEEGFITYIFPYIIIFSIVSVIASIIGFLFDFLELAAWYTYVSCGLFLIVFIVFVVMYRKGIVKYFKK